MTKAEDERIAAALAQAWTDGWLARENYSLDFEAWIGVQVRVAGDKSRDPNTRSHFTTPPEPPTNPYKAEEMMNEQEAAETLKEARTALGEVDEEIASEISKGAHPAAIARALIETWLNSTKLIDDPEFYGPVLKHVILPRVQSVLEQKAPSS